jgi:hypothetical protein
VRREGDVSRVIWIPGRPGTARTMQAVHLVAPAAAPDIPLDYEEALHSELQLHTHVPESRSTVKNALLLARRLQRAAAATVTQAERNVP